jgi:hypothetical protein
MVVAKISGGLGNQLFQYAAGRALAVRLGQPLALDTSKYETCQERTFELDHFNIQASRLPPRWQPRGLWTRRPYSSVLKRLRVLAHHARYNVFEERHDGFDRRFLAVSRRVYLDGYWQSERYFQPVAGLIRRELTLREPPDAANAALLEEIDAAEAVALHVRRGDYLLEKYVDRFGVLDLDYYRRAIERLAPHLHRPHYFVFSDDPAWARKNIRPGAPVTYVDHNSTERGFEDLRLMARCRHFIVANSTFSWWGAWLGPHPAKQVVAPRRWFVEPAGATRDRIPPGWIIIGDSL